MATTPGNADPTARRRLASGLLLVVLGLLLARTAVYLGRAVEAVRYPFQLDYGEGIVWQQMRAIAAGQGYAPIDGFPAIVFHYPPFYHLVAALAAAGTGADELLAGRTLSLASTVVAASLVGWIVTLLAPGGSDRCLRFAAALLAALLILAMQPVELWSVLMRIDIMCIALSFGGFACGLLALERPRWAHAAALLFVAAIYTKQTALAAPLAVFGTLLWLRPRTAFAGIATGLAASLAALAALTAASGGGFLRHIVLYNINRADPAMLILVLENLRQQIAVALCALFEVGRRAMALRDRAPGGWRARREALLADPDAARSFMLLAYFALATLMLGTIAKSGATINYLIEWDCLIALLAALGLLWVITLSTSSANMASLAWAMPGLLLVQLAQHPWPNIWDSSWFDRERPSAVRLTAAIRAAPKPVISDDMVAVLRGGKQVLWEPAIFAELAGRGAWDQRPFLGAIAERRFAFVVTTGQPSDRLYKARYNSQVSDAIAGNYPVERVIGRTTLHFPAGPLPAYAADLHRAGD